MSDIQKARDELFRTICMLDVKGHHDDAQTVRDAFVALGRPKERWIKISPAGIYECSGCGQNVLTCDINVYKYCHGCGRRMEHD